MIKYIFSKICIHLLTKWLHCLKHFCTDCKWVQHFKMLYIFEKDRYLYEVNKSKLDCDYRDFCWCEGGTRNFLFFSLWRGSWQKKFENHCTFRAKANTAPTAQTPRLHWLHSNCFNPYTAPTVWAGAISKAETGSTLPWHTPDAPSKQKPAPQIKSSVKLTLTHS